MTNLVLKQQDNFWGNKNVAYNNIENKVKMKSNKLKSYFEKASISSL